MTRIARIIINGRFVHEEPTGVQRFAEQIVLALARRRSDLLLVAPHGPMPGSLAHIPSRQFGRWSGSRWEQAELPRHLLAHGRPLLLNLANRSPILYRPKIVTLHDMMVQRGVGTFSRRFRATFRAMTGASIATGVRSVLTVSEFSRSEIAVFYPQARDRIHVVRNAVDSFWSREEAGTSGRGERGDRYVLAFGRSGRNRNTETIVRAARLLHESGAPVLVKWVGAPDPALVVRLGTEPSAHEVLGRVTDEELRALYRGAAAFIAPSLYEGFDLPPLEAQSAGALVIASDIPVHREVLGAGAVYFAPLDHRALAGEIQGLVDEGPRRSAVRSAATHNSGSYSWDASAERLSALLDRVRRAAS